ncbi:MAG: hypothetical protein U0931_04515 [Vulcanimicrobiota bacterium]
MSQPCVRLTVLLLALCLNARAEEPRLTVQVDLNAANLSRPLRPQHEVAFQLEARPPGKAGAPGGTVQVYRLTAGGARLLDSISQPPQAPDSPLTVKTTGYLYRQLFIWSNWQKAGPGHYQARYRNLKVNFDLP